MIRPRQTPLPSNLSTSSPENSPRSSVTLSGWDADDEGAMSAEDHLPSGSPSVGSLDHDRHSSDLYHTLTRPTLGEVLSNSAPRPWTLSAFTAYLSQNHCLENLEFTMDAERYRDRYDEMMGRSGARSSPPDAEECSYLRMLWQRLMDAYVIADGLREINIPSHVRQTLLALPNHAAPPEPDGLEIAVKIIFDLMEESVLVGFLNEVPPTRQVPDYQDGRHGSLKRRGSSKERQMKRSRSRKRGSPPASSLDAPFPPHPATLGRLSTTSNLTAGLIKASRAASHMSSGSGDGNLTDDSTGGNSPPGEPMTPPTTPPASEMGSGSPRSRGDMTWKKMLGWKKKSSGGMRDDRFPTVED